MQQICYNICDNPTTTKYQGHDIKLFIKQNMPASINDNDNKDISWKFVTQNV